MTPTEEVEIGNWAMLVERGLDPNVAKRVTKQYMDKCEEVERLLTLLKDKDYIRWKADYNRGHLSYYGQLRQRDGGITE